MAIVSRKWLKTFYCSPLQIPPYLCTSQPQRKLRFKFCLHLLGKKCTEHWTLILHLLMKSPQKGKRMLCLWIEHRTFRSSVWRSPNWANKARGSKKNFSICQVIQAPMNFSHTLTNFGVSGKNHQEQEAEITKSHIHTKVMIHSFWWWSYKEVPSSWKMGPHLRPCSHHLFIQSTCAKAKADGMVSGSVS